MDRDACCPSPDRFKQFPEGGKGHTRLIQFPFGSTGFLTHDAIPRLLLTENIFMRLVWHAEALGSSSTKTYQEVEKTANTI